MAASRSFSDACQKAGELCTIIHRRRRSSVILPASADQTLATFSVHGNAPTIRAAA